MSYHSFIDVTKGENGLKAIFNVYEDGQVLYVDELNTEMVHEEVSLLEERLRNAQCKSKQAIRNQLSEFRKAAMRMPVAAQKDEILYDKLLIPDPHAPKVRIV